jgi:hypothetical protein
MRTLLILLFSIFTAAAEAPLPASHTTRDMEGWTVRIDDRLLSGDGKTTGDHALRLLSNRLYEIAFILPADKVARLRKVPIQIDLTHGQLTSAQYHPSADWLKANGYSGKLEKTVHVPDAKEWASQRHHRIQPWSMLHELAHAYHDQVLGFENAEVAAVWEKFRANPRYNRIPHIEGGLTRHYALTNAKEFFAEMTESFFGVNDFEPFNRAELKVQEPEVFALMEKVWEGK